jgi:catecholate siderophore receptor
MHQRRTSSARKKSPRLSALLLTNAIMATGAAHAADAPAPSPTAPSQASKPGAPSTAATDASANGNSPLSSSSLNEIVVTAKPADSYQTTESANGKYTESLRDTPQSITIIPQALMQDQNDSTLQQALQNVPGITFQAGEGASLAGDNILIRGYSAQDDIFVNGFRDTGVYNHDPFNLQQVEVVKGPASAYSGHGSTGGSVNLITKEANLTPSYQGTTGFGTDQYYRDTIDINQPLGELGSEFSTTAFRLNAMYQYNEYSERNDVYDSRWGIDPTLTWGLGTDTKVTVDYLHLQEFNLPSYGIPTIRPTDIPTVTATNPSQLSHVGGVAGVPYNNFYGLVDRDYQKSTTDIPTVKVSHAFDDFLKVENTSRYENTYSSQIASPPRFEAGVDPGTSPGAIIPLQPGNVAIEQRARRQINSLFGNQTEFSGKFDTWTFKHDWVFTLEASEEAENARTSVGNGIANPPTQTSLLSPDNNAAYPFPLVWGPGTTDRIDDYAFSLFDSIKLDPHWILSGGMRFDHAESSQTGGGLPNLSRVDDLPSYRAALTYKPIEPVSLYFGYGTSYNLSIEGTSSNTGSPDGLTQASANLEPEKNQTYEFGAKWDVLKERLSLGSAFFRTTKDNTRVTDPTTNLITNAGTTRVQGIEVSAAGNITDEWKVFGGYTYMQSEIMSNPTGSTALLVGNKLPNVPDQSASLWTTYDLLPKLTIGSGANFVDKRYATTANTWSAAGYWTQQAMLAYKVSQNVKCQVNVSNLWDEHYIYATGSNSIPGSGRSVTFTTTFKF